MLNDYLRVNPKIFFKACNLSDIFLLWSCTFYSLSKEVNLSSSSCLQVVDGSPIEVTLAKPVDKDSYVRYTRGTGGRGGSVLQTDYTTYTLGQVGTGLSRLEALKHILFKMWDFKFSDIKQFMVMFWLNMFANVVQVACYIYILMVYAAS